MSIRKPIFVIGTPRSGTTLTAQILGRHSDIFMPGETHFFPDIYSHRKNFGVPPTQEGQLKIYGRLINLYERYQEPNDQKRIEKLLTNVALKKDLLNSCRGGYRESLDYFMEMQMHHEGKTRWGNNAPRDLFHAEEILSFYPDACFVACVRDLRDFLLSYKGKWEIASDQQNADRLQKLYHPVITTMLWKASMRKVAKLKSKLPANQYMVIRYEDMVVTPGKTTRKICDLVEIEFQANMLDIDTHNSSETKQQAKGIFTSSIGRWRNMLDFNEVSVAQQLAHKEMNELGYKLEHAKTDLIQVLNIYISTPYKFFSALKANASKTGPIIPYMIKRFRSLFS